MDIYRCHRPEHGTPASAPMSRAARRNGTPRTSPPAPVPDLATAVALGKREHAQGRISAVATASSPFSTGYGTSPAYSDCPPARVPPRAGIRSTRARMVACTPYKDLPDAKWTAELTRTLRFDTLFANHTTLRTGRLTIH